MTAGPLHPDWEPRLNQAAEPLEKQVETGCGMIYSTANLAAVRQAEMLYAYVLLWQASGERDRLFREQVEWEKRARAEAKEASMEYEGGTHAPVAYGLRYIDLCLERTMELRRRLKEASR
jgi:uncharacterized protein YecT (DUF1311 family)